VAPVALSPPGPWRVLTICTANMCRSPMAEAFLARKLEEADLPAVVASCGLLAPGYPVAPEVAQAMAARGLDVGGHVSQQLSAELVAGADLVLAMAREHLREVVVLSPDALGRTFTLKELVRRASVVGPRRGDTSLARWLAEVGEGRRPQDLLGSSPEDDVADPIGGPYREFLATADELEALTARLVDLLRAR
jgi:protein-tyrosine phosphatase